MNVLRALFIAALLLARPSLALAQRDAATDAPTADATAGVAMRRLSREDFDRCFIDANDDTCQAVRGNPVDARLHQRDRARESAHTDSIRAPAASVEAAVLTGVADFFVSRARAEAQLFLQDRLGRALCPAGEGDDGAARTAQRALLAHTCQTIRPGGGDFADPAQLVSLPTALRRDLEALPRTLPDWLVTQIPANTAPDERRAIHLTLCVASMLGVAAPHFGHGPPAQAFSTLGDVLDQVADPSAAAVGDAGAAPTHPDVALLQRTCRGALASDHRRSLAKAFRALAAGVQSISSNASDGAIDVRDSLWAQYVAAEELVAPGEAPTSVAGAAPRLASSDEALPWLARHRAELARLGAAIAEVRRQGSNDLRAAELLGASAAVFGAVVDHPAIADALPADAAAREAAARDLPAALEAVASILKREYVVGVVALLHLRAIDLALRDVGGEGRRVFEGLRAFGSLVATLAQARTAEEVTAALEAAAAPVGSYREMRRPGFHLSLAGHVGLFGAGETALGGYARDRAATRFVSGVALPIGLEFGWGIGCGASFQVMISAFDLGALASFAAEGASPTSSMPPAGGGSVATATVDPDVASVFAPGLFVGFGLPRLPIVISAMFEAAPALRRYLACSTSACEPTSLPTLRYGLAITIDIPVLQLR